MKRKEFFTLSAAATAGLVAGAGCSRRPAGEPKQDGPVRELINPEVLRATYRSELFERYLPALDEHVVDHEYGGFICAVDIRTGERLNEVKRTWFEGRGMWAYSFLYNRIEADPAYLEIARKSKDFILRHLPEGDRFFVHAYNRRGEPSSSEPADIYGDLFVAEGLAEFAGASGEEEYYDLAKRLVMKCVRRYDEPDYRFRDQPAGRRFLGHWMVLLIGSTHMLMIQDDPDISAIADRCIDAILDDHMNDDYHLLNEYLAHDMSLPEEVSQFAYLGHAIETLWMVMYEAVRRGDRSLLEEAAAHFRRHVEVAEDRVYGGYFRSLDHVDNHEWTVDKVLWLQEEVLIGTLLMAGEMNDLWAAETFRRTHDYVMETYARPGYKFWIPNGDRRLIEYNSSRAENYHHPRHLMLNLLETERILARNENGELRG